MFVNIDSTYLHSVTVSGVLITGEPDLVAGQGGQVVCVPKTSIVGDYAEWSSEAD
jgi:hypothetical protein